MRLGMYIYIYIYMHIYIYIYIYFYFLLMCNYFSITILPIVIIIVCIIIIIIIITFTISSSSSSRSSNSSSSNISSCCSTRIIDISVLVLISTNFELFICSYVPCCLTSPYPTYFFEGCNENKVTQLSCAICTIAHHVKLFYHSFIFNEFIFEYVVNYRFIYCDGEG